MSQNPYLFIVGCPRSGTTLLRRIIGAHPSIAITPETHWIPRYFHKRKGLTQDGFVTPDLVPNLLEYHRFDRLKLQRRDLERLITSAEPISYATFVSGIFDLYGTANGKPFVGDKTPEYVRSIRLLHSLWPTARFIHLIRDGRDVCLSATSWKKAGNLARQFPCWSEDPISTAAVWWKWNVQLGREAGYQLGPELYYEMRYESLVNNPQSECEALCKFLGVPFERSMLLFHEGRTNSEPGLSSKDAWLPITPGLRNWKTQTSGDDVDRFDAVAGDLIEELGYQRADRRPEPEAEQRASLIYDLFTENARGSGHPLPQGW